jgi:hypothetical protein
MSKIEVNKIGPQCGTTLTVGCGAGQTVAVDANTVTIGRCGGTVALASGASQTGFGREGSVNWQTSIKTSGFTAANGEGYFVDTTSGAITVNLPSASVGNIVAFKDYKGNFQNNNLIISPNGSDKIDSVNGNATISTENASITLVFADSTRGWLNVNDSTSVEGSAFITATGGTITTVCTNFKVHTFTGPGTFCVSAGQGPLAVADYLVVAGGGGGGFERGGGGGAGGYRESPGTASGCYSVSPLGTSPAAAIPVVPGAIPVTVGGGGAIAPARGTAAPNGSNSIFAGSTPITSTGGGGGGSHPGPNNPGQPGGSGGGNIHACSSYPTAGTGNTPPVTPPQGNRGGNVQFAVGSSYYYASGGGGATAVGGASSGSTNSGVGGAGATSSINGTPTARAGGGGGGSNISPAPSPGGSGGGGNGGYGPTASTAGTANTGGGGGGGPGDPASVGSAGGSGIVVVRYKYQ